MRTRLSFVSVVAAAVGLSGMAVAQQNKPGEPRAEACTIAQVAAMTKTQKLSLADSIAAAERHCGGRAVRGECCPRGGVAQLGTNGTSSEAVCVVTVLVNDNRLVEAVVNASNGQILGQRNVDSLMLFGLPPGGMSAERASGDFLMARRWQKATDLMGKKVINGANEDLGKIEEIVVDANSGRILYGVLSFGGFLGIGDKLFAIPWQSLELSGDAKAYVLSVDKDRLKTATGFDKAHWPNFADEQWATNTYKFYNQTPYWLAADGSSTNGDRWYQRATLWQKASDLCGKDIHNTQNEDIGTISDLVIDPDGARILYGVLSFRGKLFAVPYGALTLPPDAKRFVLNVDKELLKDSVSFTKDSWPNVVDQKWATEIHNHYRVEPYWAKAQTGR